MTKPRISLRYRLFVLAALIICLTALLTPATSQQTTCCTRCFQRWQQCDANDVVCCQLYESCVSQCPTSCPSCPK